MKNTFFAKGLFILVFFVSFFYHIISAQNQSGAIWVWSNYCGIDFRDTGNVVPYYGMAFNSQSTSSCLSNPDGQLIFTSNNSQFRDRYNQFVLNWDSLNPFQTTDQGFFFRSPNDTSLIHYLLARVGTNPIWVKIKDVPPIAYVMDSSIVEVSNFASNSYPYSVNHGVKSRAYDAVRHGNGRDWWIVAKMNQGYAGGSDSFVVFSLYEDSMFISSYQEIGPRFNTYIELDISDKGDKICYLNVDTFSIYEFDFDRCSGIISNPVEVYNDHLFHNNLNNPIGLAYSRSSNFIYASVSNSNMTIACSDTIYQINPRTTVDSLKCTVIWYDTTNVIGDSAGVFGFELGNDGNIYFSYSKGFGATTGNQPILSYIGVIKNADMPYPYCTIEPMGVYLGSQCQASINNYLASVPNYNLGPMIGSPCDTLNITSTGQWVNPVAQIKVFPNPSNDKININWPVQGGYTWSLKSLAGSMLSSGTQQTGNATISTATLPVGMYFLEVHSAKEHKVEKVIILSEK